MDQGTVVSEGTIIDEGTVVEGAIMDEGTIVEGAVVNEGTIVDEGTIISSSDSMEGMVIGDSSGETIISEKIISTDVIGSSEDSTTAGETTPAEIDSDADAGAGALQDTTTDLLESFSPSPSSDGATFKKRSSKVRLVFVRTNTLAKARKAKANVAKKVVKTKQAKPVLRLSFSTTVVK